MIRKALRIRLKPPRSIDDRIRVIIALYQRQDIETVRKIRKNGVKNTARNSSICDNLAAGAFFFVYCPEEPPLFKRKKPVSGHDHLHYPVYSEEVYHPSEIVGKERKPHFSGCLQLSFCQQITRSVPSFHSSVWMLDHSVPLP